MSFQHAQKSITRCLGIFSQDLKGFDAQQAVYNFAYNASTLEIEAWLPNGVRAFRTGGEAINPLPFRGQVKLTTTGYGPDNCEHHLDEHIAKLLARPSSWLIYNAHGLDDKGWGSIRAEYLEALLARLVKIENLEVLPVGKALAQYAKRIH